MVAWFTGHSTHRDGDVRAWSGVLMLTLCACAQMGDAAKSTAALPLFEKERPKSSTVLNWLKAAKPLLARPTSAPSSMAIPSIIAGLHRCNRTVPPALVPAAGGITEAAAAQRDALIIQVQDANALKIEQARSHESEIRLNLFLAIENALLLNAPLLLERLKATCKQTIPGFTDQYDGKLAWEHLVTP